MFTLPAITVNFFPLELIKLIRVKHWVKNLFLFVPVFFAGQLTNFDLYPHLILAFCSYSFIASAIYIINDWKDIEADRLHPEKRMRPLASGKVSTKVAGAVFVGLLLVGFGIAAYLSMKFAFVLIIYFVMNLAYTLGLKKISILDIFIVAVGFVLRIKAGSVATEIALSQWSIVMVFLLALFMAVAKRRDDLVLKAASGVDLRAVSKTYSLQFLDVSLSLISGIIFISYLMFCMSPEVIERMGTYRLFYTALFVLAGILRYLQIALVENNSGSPTKLLYTDRFIQVVLILWVVSFYLLIYFKDLIIFN